MTERRPSSRQRGYTARWGRARATYLTNHPLCVMCAAMGRITAASVVDHIVPHKGDPSLFWDSANWQALCAAHHNRDKQRQERTGVLQGCDADGLPIDEAHHWRA